MHILGTIKELRDRVANSEIGKTITVNATNAFDVVSDKANDLKNATLEKIEETAHKLKDKE